MLFLARTAMGLQFQSIASVSPLLLDELQIEFALLGALIGAWMLPGVVLAIPGGLLGQRVGDKNIVLIGLGLMVMGSVAIANAHSFALIMVGRLVSGAGAALLNVLLTKMLADWFVKRELATAMGILVVSWPLGIGLALILLGPLAASSSWSVAMQVTAWVCAAALVCVALIYESPPEHRQDDAVTHVGGLTRRELMFASLGGLIWTLYNVGYIIVVSFSPVLLAERGLDTASAAIIASFATWPLIATVPFGGVMADRSAHGYAIMLWGLIAMATCLPLMLAAPSPLVMLALIGALTGPPAGIIMALPARTLRPSSRYLGMGIFFTFYYVGMALLPGVAGWLRDQTGFSAAPLMFGSVILFIAAGCAVIFRRLEATVAGTAR